MPASTSIPLAEYFWIAGVESVSYDDTPLPAAVDATIAEDSQSVNGATTNGAYRNAARHSRQNSANRLSKISLDMRSLASALDGEGSTKSNRSSATIRPVNGQTNGSSLPEEIVSPGIGGKDFDFDKALIKFASEREHFLDDLTFSAGATVQARAPMTKPRTEQIRQDEGMPSGRMSPLRSLKGSIRRRISFREMGSVRRSTGPKAGKLSPLVVCLGMAEHATDLTYRICSSS